MRIKTVEWQIFVLKNWSVCTYKIWLRWVVRFYVSIFQHANLIVFFVFLSIKHNSCSCFKLLNYSKRLCILCHGYEMFIRILVRTHRIILLKRKREYFSKIRIYYIYVTLTYSHYSHFVIFSVNVYQLTSMLFLN